MGDVLKSMRDRVLVVDHHVSEDDLGDRWFKDTSAEATARIISEIGLRLRVPLTERIATPLYAGLSTDTGGFRFPSVSGESFRVARGWSMRVRARRQSTGNSSSRTRLPGCTWWAGRCRAAHASHDGRVITSIVRLADIKETAATPHDTEDLINLTLAVKGTEVAAILIEQTDGRIKVSFRSRSGVDASALAARFGGGGHKAAAGDSSWPLRRRLPERHSSRGRGGARS